MEMRKGVVDAGVIILVGFVISAILLAVPNQLITSSGEFITEDVAEHHLEQIGNSVMVVEDEEEQYIEVDLPEYEIIVVENSVGLRRGQIEVSQEIDYNVQGPDSYERIDDVLCVKHKGSYTDIRVERCSD